MLSRSHFEKLPSGIGKPRLQHYQLCGLYDIKQAILWWATFWFPKFLQIALYAWCPLCSLTRSAPLTREDLEKFSRGSAAESTGPLPRKPESARSVYFWNSHRREVIMISPLFLHGGDARLKASAAWTARWVKHSVLFLTSNWSYLSRQRLPPTATRACSAAERTDSLIYHRVFSFF